MIFIILSSFLPTFILWEILSAMITCMNGWGTGLNSGIEGTWHMLLLVLAMIVLFFATSVLGGIQSLKPIAEIDDYEIYQTGNRFLRSKRGSMGLATILINFFKVLLVGPIIGIVQLIRLLFKKDIEKDYSRLILGYVIFLIAGLLLAFPFFTHKSRVSQYDCNDFQFEVTDIYPDNSEYSRWAYLELKVSHPTGEISALNGNLYFYIDGELVHTDKYKCSINEMTMGLMSMKEGQNEDLAEFFVQVAFNSDPEIVTLYQQNSDRLVIEHEITYAAFRRGTVTTERAYLENIPKATIYPAG